MKKILYFLEMAVILIAILALLTSCSSEEKNISNANSQVESNIQEDKNDANSKENILKSFAEYINNEDYDNAIKLIDVDVIHNILKIDLTQEELSKAYESSVKKSSTDELRYDISSITLVEKNKITETLKKYNILEKPESTLELFDGYDFYTIKYTLNENGNSHELYDAMIMNEETFAGTVVTNGLLRYYYNAIHNRPTSEN